MAVDWLRLEGDFDARTRRLAEAGVPGHAGFLQLVAAASAEGPLAARHKELIALAIAIQRASLDCIAYHVRLCVRAGTSREELLHMLSVAIEMGGGPALANAADVLECYDAMAGSRDEPQAA